MAEPLGTRRGSLPVPTFLPDATRAGVRAVSSQDLRAVGVEGVVVNAFHLLRRPGGRVVQAAGGIHRFMDWNGPILSDSGGFQVWSLIRQDPNRGVIRDNEVIFREPATGEKWNLTPERVVTLQPSSARTYSSAWTRPRPTTRKPSRSGRWSGRCAGPAAHARSSTAVSPSAGATTRRASSPWSRAEPSSPSAGNVRRSWPRSASTAMDSADGRSAPTAPCSPIPSAGSRSRSRPRP